MRTTRLFFVAVTTVGWHLVATAQPSPTKAKLSDTAPPAPPPAVAAPAEASAPPAIATPHPIVIDKRAMQDIAAREAKLAGLPFSLVDSVIKIESDYRPDRIGDVGEIGLMQVRPTTAAMLGFHGTTAELADPATNIHYGATYLGTAWRLAKGDVCRALMKYRAGHGNETMTTLSVTYCERARVHLVNIGSPLAATITPADLVTTVSVPSPPRRGIAGIANETLPGERLTVGGRPKTGQAFWSAFQSRIKRINTGIEAKWRRTASR